MALISTLSKRKSLPEDTAQTEIGDPLLQAPFAPKQTKRNQKAVVLATCSARRKGGPSNRGRLASETSNGWMRIPACSKDGDGDQQASQGWTTTRLM